MICLTDDIYENKIPHGMEGHHFCYKVVGYDSEKKEFTAKYQLRMIKDDGCEWKHLDGEREVMDGLTHEHVKEGLELYNRALGRINSYEYEKTNAAKESLKRKAITAASVVREEDVIMSDFEQAAHEARYDGGWMSQAVLDVSFIYTNCAIPIRPDIDIPYVILHIIQVEFKLTRKPTKRTPTGLDTREWVHRLLPEYTFMQQQNP